MSNIVKHKRSSVASQVPTSGQIDVGEIAINLADQKIYTKRVDGTVILIGSGASSSSSTVPTSDTPPSSPTDGTLWWDSADGNLYIYYEDGTSNQWVPANSTSFTTGGGSVATSVYDSEYTLTGTTTNSTETEIFIDGVSNSRILLTENKLANYKITFSGRRTDVANSESCYIELKSSALNLSGTVSDVGSVFETVIQRSDANLNVDARVEDTDNTLRLYVTGLASKTFQWKAIISIVEV